MSTESSLDLDEVASDWIARRDSANWSGADEAEFNRWLDASDLHQIAYLRLGRVWEEARRLKALGAGVPSRRVPAPGQWVLTPFFDAAARSETNETRDAPQTPDAARRMPPSSLRMRWPALWSVAATVVLAASVYWLNGAWVKGKHYSTPVGGLSSLPLADGSKIVLNTASEVRVDLTPAERRVELEHGEAFFEVAKDPTRPFVVAAGDKRIVVVGTQFSVRREGSDIRVAVTEGSVRVESAHATLRSRSEQLIAGTVARTGKAGTLVQQKPLSEVEEELSWRGGLLVFRNQTLADAVAEFNRYTERKIVIRDARVAGLRIAGSFRSSNAEDFVELLEQGYPVRVESKDEKILLLAR